MSIDKEFEGWLRGFERADNTTLDHIRELRIASSAYTAGAIMIKEKVVDIMIGERTNQKRLSKLREFNIGIDTELEKK